MEPVLERSAERNSRVRVTKLDVHAETPHLFRALRTWAVIPKKLPTLILFQNGLPVAQRAGILNDDQLDTWLRQHVPSRMATA